MAEMDKLEITDVECKEAERKRVGLARDLNPGPRASEARIIPLDQRATVVEPS